MNKIVAITSFFFSFFGILWLTIIAPVISGMRQKRVKLFVIDTTVSVVDEDLLRGFLECYNNVLQVTPTTWYIVSNLSLVDIGNQLINKHVGLKLSVYQVSDVLSSSDRSVYEWLIKKGLIWG